MNVVHLPIEVLYVIRRREPREKEPEQRRAER
jgi:hypothetical protein